MEIVQNLLPKEIMALAIFPLLKNATNNNIAIIGNIDGIMPIIDNGGKVSELPPLSIMAVKKILSVALLIPISMEIMEIILTIISIMIVVILFPLPIMSVILTLYQQC